MPPQDSRPSVTQIVHPVLGRVLTGDAAMDETGGQARSCKARHAEAKAGRAALLVRPATQRKLFIWPLLLLLGPLPAGDTPRTYLIESIKPADQPV